MSAPTNKRSHRPGHGLRFRLAVLASQAAILSLLVAGSLEGVTLGRSLQEGLRADFRAGQSELQIGRATLTAASANHSPEVVEQARQHFAKARSIFTRSQRRLDSSPMVAAASAAPFTGSRIETAHALVAMSLALCDAGLGMAHTLAGVISPPGPGLGSGGALILLEQSQRQLGEVSADLDRALAAAKSVRPDLLSAGDRAGLASARSAALETRNSLRSLERLLPIVADILGLHGRRTYLLEQVNPAELRPGGGFFGTYSVLVAESGQLRLLSSGDTYDLVNPRPRRGDPGYVAPPVPLGEFLGDNSWSLVDSNWFPDFPANARAAETFAGRLGVTLDGVLAIDYYAVAGMLELTGPIAVKGFGVTVQSTTLVSDMISRDLDTDASGRKHFVAAITEPLLLGLSGLPAPRWPQLLATISQLIEERHLQVYFNDPMLEQELDSSHLSGTLNPFGATDFVMALEANLGGTKANQWLTRQYSVTLGRSTSGLHHSLRIDLQNHMPALANNYYRFYVRLYVPADATNLAVGGLQRDESVNPDAPPGAHLMDGWWQVNVDPASGWGRTHYTFDYDTPWQPDASGKHPLYWQKQPGTLDDRIDVTWLTGGQTYAKSFALSQARWLDLSPAGLAVEPVAAPAWLHAAG